MIEHRPQLMNAARAIAHAMPYIRHELHDEIENAKKDHKRGMVTGYKAYNIIRSAILVYSESEGAIPKLVDLMSPDYRDEEYARIALMEACEEEAYDIMNVEKYFS